MPSPKYSKNRSRLKETPPLNRDDDADVWEIVKFFIKHGLIIVVIAFTLYCCSDSRKFAEVVDSASDVIGKYITLPPIILAGADSIIGKTFFERKCEKSSLKQCYSKCGQMVSDRVLGNYEISVLTKFSKSVLSDVETEASNGILDLVSGALTHNDKFINAYKSPQVNAKFTREFKSVYKQVFTKLRDWTAENFNVNPENLYLTKPSIFSHMFGDKAVTVNDEYWHKHIDTEQYGGFSITTLIYLTTYRKDFTGGRFVFIGTPQNVTVEPVWGRVLAFSSGPENPHYVEKVTSGDRYALTVAFTCDKKYAIDLSDLPFLQE